MRLSHRLTLVFSLFGLAIAGGLQYGRIRELRREVYAREEAQADVTTAAIKALVEDQARAQGLIRLGKNLEEIVRKTGVATIAVLDSHSRRIIGRSDDARLIARQPHPGVAIDKTSDGFYDLSLPANLGARGRGTVVVGFSTGALEQRLRHLGASAVSYGVMAFLAIALMAYWLGTWFVLRIEAIVPRIEALAKDPEEFKSIRQAGHAKDEVGRLVAAFNRLGATLKSETKRRLELEEEKRELMAMLVHDLKTPLTVIRSGITLLEEQLAESGGLDKIAVGRNNHGRSSRRTFELLELSTERLQRMVEDVLQLSRLEEVPGLREKLVVDLAAMATSCSKDFELVAISRKQTMSLKLGKDRIPAVLGDQALLRRVLDNLVHNAIEHTPPGGSISISVSAGAKGVRVEVSDSGPGIPPEARPDIFQKFYQRDVKRHVGNVGLGLALCEKVVLRHEGTIGIEDAEPRGARFYFVLPASPSASA